MTAFVIVVALIALFNLGVLAGAFISYVGTANNSFDVWEVTNREGATYYLVDPVEVEAALVVDGFLQVRRLRVLT